MANERKAARRVKRGGGRPPLSLDFAGAETELSAQSASTATDQVDERADVYALGALLSALAAADAPGRTTDELPRPLAAIIARAQDHDPGRRYPGVRALAADVSRFLDRLPVEAYRETARERLGGLASKYRTPLLLIAAYLVMRTLLAFFVRV